MNEGLLAKIELWKIINEYSNRIELSYQFFSSLLISVIGVVIALCKDNLIPDKVFNNKFIVLCFVPITVTAIIGYLAYNFRWVAIARMYSAAIEREINSSLEKEYFVWDSDIVNKFMARNNFVNRVFLPVINFIFIFSTAMFLNYSMFNSKLDGYIKIIYLIATTVMFACSLVSFFGNEKVRTFEYKFKKDNEGE